MNRDITIIIASFFIASVLGVLVLSPKYHDLEDIQFRLEEKKIELQSKEKYFSRLREISSELENYQDSILKINSAIPQNPFLPSLYDFIQNKISESGLVLEEINLEVIGKKTLNEEKKEISEIKNLWQVPVKEIKPDDKRIKEILINLSIFGNYSNFKNFLSKLEKTARLIEIKSINLFSPKEQGKPFEFKLIIITHSY